MGEETQKKHKLCFVVIPIGTEGSDTRKHSDQVFRYIVRPAAETCGYTSIRAIEDKRPGIIGTQIIDHLFEANLVIADLSEHNPNVFYEVAIRHATHKPIVQIIRSIDRIPFDVAQQKTISFNLSDLDSVEDCKNEIIAQIHEVEANPALVDNPISTARRISAALESPVAEVRSNAEMLAMMEGMALRIENLTVAVARLAENRGRPRKSARTSDRLRATGATDTFLLRADYLLDDYEDMWSAKQDRPKSEVLPAQVRHNARKRLVDMLSLGHDVSRGVVSDLVKMEMGDLPLFEFES